MGRFKDIAIGQMERADQDCPNDEELQVLMENFKPTAEEMQNIHAILDELQAHEVILPCIKVVPDQIVYLLMCNGSPVRVYTDKALAFYECWVCTAGERYVDEPSEYYITEVVLDRSTMEE
jgi:hypothetical protein